VLCVAVVSMTCTAQSGYIAGVLCVAVSMTRTARSGMPIQHTCTPV